MKTKKNLILFYDDQCPMCNLYSKWFVSAGLISSEGRMPFQKIYEFNFPALNVFRAQNEIALLDKESGEVTYGIESLFKLLLMKMPFLKFLFRNKVFKWIMTRIYFVISFNRKVIAPARKECDRCVPELNLKYRFIYILFAWLVSSIILTVYSFFLKDFIPATNFYREFLICGGQILFQGILIYTLAKNKIWDYLGNMMSVSLAASLILGIFIFISILFYFPFHSLFYLILFFVIVALMFLEHWRRMKLLEISFLATIGWMVYRLLVLLIIFYYEKI